MNRKIVGGGLIALAVGFNLPFALLAARLDYPDILRRPVAEVLTAFQAGGPALVWIWYGFAITAVLLIPLAIALAFSHPAWQSRPIISIGGAIIGALAGMAQAIGLFRWVFAVPPLAQAYVDPSATEASRAALEAGFALMNTWGGVAIGEHLGQILTILWIAHVASGQWADGRWFDRIGAGLAVLAMLGIGVGLGEGLGIALNAPQPVFAMFTITGFMAFTLWLVGLGLGMVLSGNSAGEAQFGQRVAR